MSPLWKFVLSMGKVGCIGFGGGSALIPVIEQEVIEKQKLDTQANFDKDIIVASITPGALPVELAASLGRRNFGGKGMILGACAMALPGAFATLLLLAFLSIAQERILRVIHVASVGVSAFILFLLIHYVKNVLTMSVKRGRKDQIKTVFVLLLVFFLVGGKNLYRLLGIQGTPWVSFSTIEILGSVFFVLILRGIWESIQGKSRFGTLDLPALRQDLLIWFLFGVLICLPSLFYGKEAWLFAGKGLLSAVMSFGGGDAYLTIAEGMFVESGMLSETMYYGQVVAVVNVLPGSILCKTLLGTGYCVGRLLTGTVWGGVLFGLAGFACSIAASCGFFSVVYHMYESLTSLQAFQVISHWIRPIIGGLLLNVMLSLGNQCGEALEFSGISFHGIWAGLCGLVLLDFALERWRESRPALLLVGNLLIVSGISFWAR